MPEDQLAGLYALAESAGMLLPGDPGYPNAKDLWGLVYHLKGPAGEELLLLALRGGEISNDHYPYYEFFFTRTSAGTWQFDSAHRFFFDIAGMEGAEFFALTLGFSILGLAITVPITIAFLLYRVWRDYRCAIPSLEVVLPNKSA